MGVGGGSGAGPGWSGGEEASKALDGQNWRDNVVIAAIALEALIQPSRGWVYYSRNKNSARVGEFTVRRIAKAVDWLADQGLVKSLHVASGPSSG